jgi:hypothetical protein
MTEAIKRPKIKPTERQMEIRQLAAKGRSNRSDQESARLDQLNMEERRDRFVRLAPKRVKHAVRVLRQIGNMGNLGSYYYDPSEAGKIISILEDALQKVRASFAAYAKSDAQFLI